MGKLEANKQQKLTSLLNTAFNLFTTQGVTKTSIAEISQKAGIAKGTFYLYFKDKYDIIHFLRREMLDFTAFPVFFVSNLLLVQRKKYYFNRAMVSRNCSIVL